MKFQPWERNRNHSYNKVKPDRQHSWARIMRALRKHRGGMTLHELAAELTSAEHKRIGLHQISGRITELRELGHVVFAGSRWNAKTNRSNSVWTVKA